MTDSVNRAVDRPVRSLQNALRQISKHGGGIPPVVPDGFYGGQTAESVAGFQQKFGLPVTGETDSATWDAVMEEFERIERIISAPRRAAIWPDPYYVVAPGGSDIAMFTVQAIMLVLSRIFDNVPKVEVSGTNDSATVDGVIMLRGVFGQEENPSVDKIFWDALVGLYEAVR